MKVWHWNVNNSILSENCFRVSLLKFFNASHNYDFVCLSETFLSPSVSSTLDSVNIDDYNIVQSDHPSGSKRRGVCCYFKETLPISRHFRPKLVHWNESVYCTPIDRALKMRFNRGSGSFYDQPFLSYEGFVKSIAPFFGQNKYTKIRRFSTIFRHKIRFLCLQKVQQNTILSKMATQHIFN